MRRDYITDFLFLLFLAALGVMVWAMSSKGAPAPLTKRPTKIRHNIPCTCVMYWHSHEYHTTFAPGGRYQAIRANNNSERWTGTWEVKRDDVSDILTIRESNGDVMLDNYSTYVIRMRPCLRSSECDRVILEPR